MIPDTTNLNTYTHNVKKMNMIHIQPQEEKPIRPMPDHPCISHLPISAQITPAITPLP
jgi:hypothetical protein